MCIQAHLLFKVFQNEVTSTAVEINFFGVRTNFQLTLPLALTLIE